MHVCVRSAIPMQKLVAHEWTVYSRFGSVFYLSPSNVHMCMLSPFAVTIICCGICACSIVCRRRFGFSTLDIRPNENSQWKWRERWKEKCIFRASVPHGKHKHFISIHIKLWFEKYIFASPLSPWLRLCTGMGREWVRGKENETQNWNEEISIWARLACMQPFCSIQLVPRQAIIDWLWHRVQLVFSMLRYWLFFVSASAQRERVLRSPYTQIITIANRSHSIFWRINFEQ